MLEPEFAKWLITLGVGGALAAFIFIFYRKDSKLETGFWRAATEQLIIVIKENTASNTKVISLMESIERNAMRKSDIISLIDKKILISNGKDFPDKQ